MARKTNHSKNLVTQLEAAVASLKALLAESANKENPVCATPVKKARRSKKANV
jgi:hypothetical protein